MARLRKDREALVDTMTRELDGVVGVVVAGFAGVKTPELNDLRLRLRPSRGRCTVVKNTLAKIAFKNRGLDAALSRCFEGPSALITQKGDALAGLKVLVEFEKSHQNVKIRGGYLFGQVVPAAELKAMATLPPRDVLLSHLLARLQGPVTALASVLTADLKNLANLLDRIAHKKQGQA